MHAKALTWHETDDYPARIGQVFVAELAERSRAPRHGTWCFGHLDLRAQAEVLSARRTDTRMSLA
jgi:hypothetical protein